MNYFISIIPILISLASLIISIKLYRQNTPKLIINIRGQSGAFYGATRCEKEKNLSTYMAGVKIRIKNNSPMPLMISQISLCYKNDIFELADNTIQYHKEKEFYFFSSDGITTDGSSVSYDEEGIQMPYLIGAFETKDITALFLSFPRSDEKKLKAKLLIDTAIGEKSINILLELYDEEFSLREFIEIDKYLKSL